MISPARFKLILIQESYQSYFSREGQVSRGPAAARKVVPPPLTTRLSVSDTCIRRNQREMIIPPRLKRILIQESN